MLKLSGSGSNSIKLVPMNQHSLKLIFRRLASKPLFPVISILGLTLGFLTTILVTSWVRDEFSYDQHLADADRVYRLTVKIDNDEVNWHWDFARSFYGWLMDMPEKIPGIESMTRFSRWQSGIAKYEETVIAEELFTADPSIIDMFSLKMINGDPATCLTGPGKVIISESLAKKFFGDEDPMEKTLYLYCSNCPEKKPYQVSGVYKDVPFHAHVHFNLIQSVEKPDESFGWAYYYVKLKPETDPDDVISAFNGFAKNYVSEKDLATLTPSLQRITDIHLKSAKDRELEKNGSLVQVKMISGLAIFVLIISLFNYFNLRFINLLKDLKSLKILSFAGARSGGLLAFLYTESLIFCLAASLLTLLIIITAYPLFSQFIGRVTGAEQSSIMHTLLLFLPVLALISSLVGILPFWMRKSAGYLKRMVNSQAQQSTAVLSGAGSKVLRALVGLQYLSALIMIVAVFVIQGQIRLFMDHTLTRKGEQIFCIRQIPVQVINKYPVFKEELMKNPLIYDVTSSMEEPGYEVRDMTGIVTQGLDDSNNKRLFLCPVDDNFFNFYNIPIIAGNDFPKYSDDDTAPENFILNEKALEYLGWETHEAVGRSFRITQQYASKKMGRIVGIVQDFQPATMKEEVQPTVYMQKSYWLYTGHIRYDTSNSAASIAAIQKVWDQVYPDFPLEYEFVDNLYRMVYAGEFQLRRMSMLLCILALIIASSGLIGITGITYEVRTKEIGIRKVNGASIARILQWLMGDVITLVSVSAIVAVPLAWYLMHRWLSNYAIRSEINFGMILLAVILLYAIAFLTVGWQSWKAATRNPVEALRYE